MQFIAIKSKFETKFNYMFHALLCKQLFLFSDVHLDRTVLTLQYKILSFRESHKAVCTFLPVSS